MEISMEVSQTAKNSTTIQPSYTTPRFVPGELSTEMFAHQCLLRNYSEGLTHCNRQKHFLSNLPRAKPQWGRVGSRAWRQVYRQSCLPSAGNSGLPGSRASKSGMSKMAPVGISLRMALCLKCAGTLSEGRNWALVDLLFIEQGWEMLVEEWMNGTLGCY